MADPQARPAEPTIRTLSQGLADAEDLKMIKAVALVDAMPTRGAADGLIAPLRPRLASLRPQRPLNFARLLFMPLDPLIVPATRWRITDPSIPRTVLMCFAATVRAALGPVVQPVETLISGRTTRHSEVAAQAGAILWPAAAVVLMSVPKPVGWEDTGLNIALFPPLARRLGALLEQTKALDALVAAASAGVAQPGVEPVLGMLSAIAARTPDALPMMVALILGRLPQASSVLGRAASSMGRLGGATMRLAGNQASEVLIAQMETPGGMEAMIAGSRLTEAGAAVRRVASLLRALDDESSPTGRRDRLRTIRQRLDTACRASFSKSLTGDLLRPLQTLAQTPGTGPTTHLEAAARGLRELETEARSLGGSATYDEFLREAANEVSAGISLSPVRRARLVEILAGTDAAMALLTQGSDGSRG
jgi:hypothetical protein